MDNFSNLYFNQSLIILDTKASTSTTTGSLVVFGGASLQDTNISGTTSISNSTVSTNTASGALIVFGGVGVANNIHVGGNAIISGDLSTSRISTLSGSLNASTTAQTLFTTPTGSNYIITAVSSLGEHAYGMWSAMNNVDTNIGLISVSGLTLSFSGNNLRLKTNASTASVSWSAFRTL
jgi:hypothetical protein